MRSCLKEKEASLLKAKGELDRTVATRRADLEAKQKKALADAAQTAKDNAKLEKVNQAAVPLSNFRLPLLMSFMFVTFNIADLSSLFLPHPTPVTFLMEGGHCHSELAVDARVP